MKINWNGSLASMLCFAIHYRKHWHKLSLICDEGDPLKHYFCEHCGRDRYTRVTVGIEDIRGCVEKRFND